MSRRFSRGTTRKGGAMKLITAVIQPNQAGPVREAIEALGLGGATVTAVSGVGRQKGLSEHYRGADYTPHMVPKTKVEVVVNDEVVEGALEAIVAAARTGAIGDGKVWVSPIEEVVRVRTGERGAEAV